MLDQFSVFTRSCFIIDLHRRGNVHSASPAKSLLVRFEICAFRPLVPGID